MIATLCNLFSFGHKECKRELHRLMQAALDDNKRIKSLNEQIMNLLSQVQELKGVYEYQTAVLEKKVADLEREKQIAKARRRNKKPKGQPQCQ